MPSGRVKWFNPQKGFGFIAREDGSEDLFVHQSALGQQVLNEGDEVEFLVDMGLRGPIAIDVHVMRTNRDAREPRARGGFAPTSRTDISTLPLKTGVIDRFDDERGYGFIRPEDGSSDVFFHRTVVGTNDVMRGDSVEFRLGSGPKGPRAEHIRIVRS